MGNSNGATTTTTTTVPQKQKVNKLNEDDKERNLYLLKEAPLKFPPHIHNGADILMASELTSTFPSYEEYNAQFGGRFKEENRFLLYVYESVMKKGVKCQFEIKSNITLADSFHCMAPAVRIHEVEMSVYKVDENKKELMMKERTDNCSFENIIPEESNREKISQILDIVGIADLSHCERASWNILMEYMRVYSYFHYYRLVPVSNNSENIWRFIYNDITNFVDTQGRIITYEGDELKYSADLKDGFKILTITFNGKIVYKANYPERESNRSVDSRIYSNEMVCEVDERTLLHPVFNFIQKLLQLALKLNFEKRLTMEEMEKEWYLCSRSSLGLLFDFGNYKHCFNLSLDGVLKNSLAFSDVCFQFNDEPNDYQQNSTSERFRLPTPR